MRLTDFVRSSYFRFAVLLTLVFFSTYVVMGLIAFRSIHYDLDTRVMQTAELAAEYFEDSYEAGGATLLVNTVRAYAATLEDDEALVWLGGRNGDKLAGMTVATPMALRVGDITGVALQADPEERYRLAIRELGERRLIVAFSYEEADDILEEVVEAFGWATTLIVLVALVAVFILSRRAHGRLDSINSTLRSVALGTMSARVPVVV